MLLRLDSFEIIPEYSKYKGEYLVREGEEKMTKKRKKKSILLATQTNLKTKGNISSAKKKNRWAKSENMTLLSSNYLVLQMVN